MNLELIYQNIGHAEKLFEILSNPRFIYLSVKPKSLQDEIDFLANTDQKRKEDTEHNFTIFLDGEIVGAFGIKVDKTRKHAGKIGGYVDEKYWGKGIADFATKWCLDFMKNNLKMHICETIAHPDNIGSQKLMMKNGFTKVGLMKDYYLLNGEFQDREIFYKIL